MGMGGTLGAFIGFYIKFGADQLFIPILVTIILSGLIMTARLQLKAHDFYQIIAGFLVGLAISISSIILFL
jgi:membrane-associated phospholipid phosphatase